MRQCIGRRKFVAGLGSLGVAAAGVGWLAGCSPGVPPASPQATSPPSPPSTPSTPQTGRPAATPEPTQAPAKPKTLDKVTVRLDWLVSGYHAPFFVALDKGLFIENGLDVTVGDGRGSVPTIQTVGSGQETFGVADATALPKAVQLGAPVKMIVGYQQVNSSAVMFLKDSGIKTPKDLEGKKYGDVPGGAQSLLFPAFLRAAGVDREKITIITTDPANKDRGLLQRQYDATLTQLNDGYPKLKAQGYDVGYLAYSDYGVNVLAQGLIAGAKTLQENADLVRRFVKSWLRALEVTKEDLAAAARISKRANPDSPTENIQVDQLREAMQRVATRNTQGKPAGWMSEADWQQTIDLLFEYGALDQKIAPNQLFTNDFLPK